MALQATALDHDIPQHAAAAAVVVIVLFLGYLYVRLRASRCCSHRRVPTYSTLATLLLSFLLLLLLLLPPELRPNAYVNKRTSASASNFPSAPEMPPTSMYMLSKLEGDNAIRC